MKMIKIDAEHQRLVEIEFDSSDSLKALQSVCGGCVTTAVELSKDGKAINSYLEHTNTVYVDDEGLLKGYSFGFEIIGGHQPFIGNGTVTGTNAMGHTTNPTITIKQLEKVIDWLVFVPQ